MSTELTIQAFIQDILVTIVAFALYGHTVTSLGASGDALFGALGAGCRADPCSATEIRAKRLLTVDRRCAQSMLILQPIRRHSAPYMRRIAFVSHQSLAHPRCHPQLGQVMSSPTLIPGVEKRPGLRKHVGGRVSYQEQPCEFVTRRIKCLSRVGSGRRRPRDLDCDIWLPAATVANIDGLGCYRVGSGEDRAALATVISTAAEVNDSVIRYGLLYPRAVNARLLELNIVPRAAFLSPDTT